MIEEIIAQTWCTTAALLRIDSVFRVCVLRVLAPHATACSLVGDFNNGMTGLHAARITCMWGLFLPNISAGENMDFS